MTLKLECEVVSISCDENRILVSLQNGNLLMVQGDM